MSWIMQIRFYCVKNSFLGCHSCKKPNALCNVPNDEMHQQIDAFALSKTAFGWVLWIAIRRKAHREFIETPSKGEVKSDKTGARSKVVQLLLDPPLFTNVLDLYWTNVKVHWESKYVWLSGLKEQIINLCFDVNYIAVKSQTCIINDGNSCLSRI